MLIYRVEAGKECYAGFSTNKEDDVKLKERTGPYDAFQVYWQTRNHSECRNTPIPRYDGLDLSYRSFYGKLFGFESLHALMKWFLKKELKKLFKLGFRISIYEVPERNIKKGKKQLIFTKSKAKLLTTFVTLQELAEA